jgi:hypothetical protein
MLLEGAPEAAGLLQLAVCGIMMASRHPKLRMWSEGMMLEIVLALAGAAGLALLVQSRPPLPSPADYKKAQEKLKLMPEDPDANLTAGKYEAFVLGDYDQGMRSLAKSGDKTLRTLAEHEIAPLYADTPMKQAGLGDEWVNAAKSFPALSRIFYDRASHWYGLSWPEMKNEPLWGQRLREQGKKLAASRPPGASRKGLPAGWNAYALTAGARPPVLDGSVARNGSYSIKIVPSDEKIKGAMSGLLSDLIPVSGKSMEISAYVLSDETENGADRVFVNFFDQAGTGFATVGPFVTVDTPFWTRVYAKADVPPNASRIQFGVRMDSKKGNIWIDDASVKVDGKEILRNGSFEEK